MIDDKKLPAALAAQMQAIQSVFTYTEFQVAAALIMGVMLQGRTTDAVKQALMALVDVTGHAAAPALAHAEEIGTAILASMTAEEKD